MASSSTPTVYARMELSLTEAEKRLAKFNRDLDKTMGANERRTQAAAARMNKALASSTAIDFGKGIATSAIAAGVGLLSLSAVIGKVKEALNEFGDVADKSAQSGIDPETFQEYAYAASLAGVEVNELSGALSTFNKNAGLAEVGKGKMVAALKKLNPALLENIKNATSQAERIKLATDAIDAAKDSSEKAAIATALFGDAGTKLVSVFSGGSKALADTAAKARALGIIISNDVISRADELGDEFDTATKAIDVQFKAALIDLAPVLVDTARFAGALSSAIAETVATLRGLDGQGADEVGAIKDGFDEAAETTLKFAGIIAGALVGRAVGGMIAAIPNAVRAVQALVAAISAGVGAGAALGKIAGPIGLLVGIAASAALTYLDWGDKISDATRALADQAASGAQVSSMIDDVARAQDAYKAAIANTAKAQTAASSSIVADTKREFEAKKALLELELKRQQALIAVQSADLVNKSAELKSAVASQVLTRIDTNRTGFSDPAVGRLVNLPDDITGLAKTQAAIDANPLTDEIKKTRAELELTTISADKLKEALNTTFADPGGAPGGTIDTPPAKTGGAKGAKDKADDYQRAVENLRDQTRATLAQTAAQAALNPVINDYGFALDKAKAAQDLLVAAQKAGREVTPELKAEIEALATQYGNAEAAAKKLSESQEALRQSLSDSAALGKDVFGGIIQGLRDGASAGDILTGVLDKIITKLIDMQLNMLFDGPTAGSGQGILGSLFTPLTRLFTPATPVTPTPTPVGAAPPAPVGNVQLVGGQAMARMQPVQPRTLDVIRPAAADRAGSANAPWSVQIINNGNATKVDTREGRDERGGRRLDVVVDEVVAGAMTRTGSQTNRIIRGIGGQPMTRR